jgi:hypothetical protein
MLSPPRGYARVPVNGHEPNAPVFMLPEIESPSTVPTNSIVIGIGSVIETFHATALPFTVPTIGPDCPSADWVPVNTLPSLARLTVAARSPIGVLIVSFQFPFATTGVLQG